MNDAESPTVRFFFDPTCPWTWLTSRWIKDVAKQLGFEVRWHGLSLALLNSERLEPTDATPARLQARLAVAAQALRVIGHLDAGDRNGDIDRLYTSFGTAIHVDKEKLDEKTLANALRATDLEDLGQFADERVLDDAVKISHDRAQALLAGETGSPVLSVDGNAIFGPIVSPSPTGAEALKLWEAVRAVLAMPEFFELKRNRDAPPQTS